MKDKDFCGKYHREVIKYYSNALSRRIIHKNLFDQKYCKEVITAKDGNDKIKKMIESGKPFMAGRFGGNEIRTMCDVIFEESGGKCGGLSSRTRYKITNQAGFFPDDKDEIYKLVHLYTESCKSVDLIGVWNMFLYGEITKRYMPNAIYSELKGLEPYYFDNPWTKGLKNKKVLVIHPFSDTIEMQYSKREKLYESEDILPNFCLRTVKAIQTIAGERDSRFSTWFDAFDYMYNESMKEDFDIALIGCGAYGFPLAAKIKEAGKQVIHMGGSLQILFGIKGSRWDNHEYISRLYNDEWVRPSEKEKVLNSQVVEGSCYW